MPGTVVAEIPAEDLTELVDFVIGDGKNYSGYANKVSFFNAFYE